MVINLKNFKVFIIAVIAVFTFLSILYLSIIALRIQKYAFKENKPLGIIFYTKTPSNKLNSSLTYVKQKINEYGWDAVIIEYNDEYEKDEKILESIKKYTKYYIFEIDEGRSVINSNTILLRLRKNDEREYERALKIKNNLSDKNIKLNIVTNTLEKTKGYNVIKLEISDKNSYESARDLILNAVVSFSNDYTD
ncbi:hypothetical protein SAMN05443428_101244 [Caloramator quimbayensis]|uniref:Uncharacterized protein n=1 Tax=Caloramator quimbayensis TaxID=1147123 RepID=A0A1T4WIE3_9CLOT|nr:hypothetical protein [Caloramator quimbayensis]SKA76688.1 hypothetical protein SAMN05443428_101244 [Caloramator quimbayensis]